MNLKRISLTAVSIVAALSILLVSLPFMLRADSEVTSITNNAYTEFSATENPNGVWSYEYRTKMDDGSYTYAPLTANSGTWGNSTTGTVTTIASCMVSREPALTFTPANNLDVQLVLTYTAPETGTASIKLTNGGVFSNKQNKNIISFILLRNDTVIREANDIDRDYNTRNPYFGDEQGISLKKGDKVRFVVAKNALDNSDYAADFNPEITYITIEEAKPTEYDAAADYTSGEMNGQWRYYSRNSKGQYAPLAVNGSSWGVGANCSIGSANSDTVTGKSAVSMHSGVSLDPTLAFVAPYTGTIELSMANGGIFAPNSGFDGVKLTVYHNDTVYFESKVNSTNNYEGYRVWADAKTIDVIAGDVLYFSINQNANTKGDSVYFNPHVKYINVIGEYDGTLRFLETDEIETSNLYKDSFDISWPQARGGIAEYTYTVHISTTPITGVPLSGGIEVGSAREYSFTGLEAGTAYYVGVVASDGVSKTILYNTEPVNTISKMFVFSAFDDYAAENQKSPWSYEYLMKNGKDYEKLAWNGSSWGNAATTGTLSTATTDMVTGNPTVLIEPAADSTVSLTFTAPYTGTFDLSLANGGIMVPYNGAGNNWDGINFILTQNGKEIVKYEAVTAANAHASSMGAMYKGRLFTETLQLTVTAGDVIRFAVDKNKAIGNDKTYIAPEIIYTSVAEGALDLHFEDGKLITGSNITDSEITVNIPTAFGGTGNYEYTVYYSNTPITAIPASGGVALGEKTSYTLKELPAYTNYYFAATVFDGENTATLINSKPISTIGNTYAFNAYDDWSNEGQPINTPWRYYMQEIKTGALTELTWNTETKKFTGGTVAPSISVGIIAGNPVAGGRSLQTHPDTNYNSVVAFISPYSGNITVDVTTGGVYAPYNGAAQNHDGINFSVLKGTTVLYSKNGISGANNHNDRGFSSGVSLTVKRGEVIYFVVNRNANVNADSTFYNPQISYTFVEKGSDAFAFMPGAAVSGTNVTETSLTLNWSSAFGPNGTAVNYKVWTSKSPITKQPTSAPAYNGSGLKLNMKGLTIGTNYYAYVLATDSTGATAVLNSTTPVRTISPVYNAYEQYNTTNGAGVWNYTLREMDTATGEYYYVLAVANENGAYGNANSTGSINKAASDQVTGGKAISMHPGPNNKASALVFTAPYSGEISITMANGAVFCPNNGPQQNNDGINFQILKDGEKVYELETVSGQNNAVGKRLFTEPFTISIKQGEKLYFVVGANTSNAADSTYFNPQIEYLNITGGTGIVTLEGFVIPEVEEDPNGGLDPLTDRLMVRDNKPYTDKSVKAVSFGPEPENNAWALWIILGALGFSIIGGAVIVLLSIKKKHK